MGGGYCKVPVRSPAVVGDLWALGFPSFSWVRAPPHPTPTQTRQSEEGAQLRSLCFPKGGLSSSPSTPPPFEKGEIPSPEGSLRWGCLPRPPPPLPIRYKQAR